MLVKPISRLDSLNQGARQFENNRDVNARIKALETRVRELEQLIEQKKKKEK